MNSNYRTILLWVGGIVLIALAYRSWGWQGVIGAVTIVVFWLALHFNRLMAVLKRAKDSPIGYLDSAVMFNAKLKPGVSMLHVVAMTRSLGQPQSALGKDPEVMRWTDPGGSWVDCEFVGGKLVRWTMVRPPEDIGQPEDTSAPAQQPPSAP